MKRTNILYIETGLGFGGAVTCLVALLKRLDREKYYPLVVSTHNDEFTKSLIENTGTTFVYIKKYQRKNNLNDVFFNLGRLNRGIKNLVLSILITIESIHNIPFYIKLMKIIKNKKIDIVNINTGIGSNHDGIIISKLMKVPCVCHIRGPEYDSKLTRKIAKFVTSFIAVSKFVESSVKNIGCPSEKIMTIYDGVDTNSCRSSMSDSMPKDMNLFNFKKYNIGLFACILPWKGHKVFIETVKILLTRYNLKDCGYFIVGDVPGGDLKYKEDLVSTIYKLNLSEYITFTGYQKDINYFMDKMDIIVHTSVEPEPFGRVIIEAMARGKPVIATDAGGPREIIRDGVNGILVPPNRSDILAEQVVSLLKNEDLYIKLSKYARDTVYKHFNQENCIKHTESAYEKVLQNTPIGI